MDTLPSADIEDLPIVLNYILTQKMNLRNVVEVGYSILRTHEEHCLHNGVAPTNLRQIHR